MRVVAAVVMGTKVVFPVEDLYVLKVGMATLPVARSITQPLLLMQRAVAPLEGLIFLRGKPVKFRWVHSSHVAISQTNIDSKK
jgi:hypothetical protein